MSEIYDCVGESLAKIGNKMTSMNKRASQNKLMGVTGLIILGSVKWKHWYKNNEIPDNFSLFF